VSKKHQLPFLRKRRKTELELPVQPPLHFGPFSNGEVFFRPGPQERLIHKLILEKADEGARRHGIDRREFLASTMGMATTLWAVNLVACSSSNGGGSAGMAGGGLGFSGSGGTGGAGGALSGGSGGNSALTGGSGGSGGGISDGGFFDVPPDPTDPEQVCEVMLDASKEFIFDIQTHHVNRADTNYDGFLRDQLQFTSYCGPNSVAPLDCFGRNEYVRLMFLESDTTVAVLSGLPAATTAGNPITNDELAQAREIINLMADGTQRLVNHHMVLPNRMGENANSVSAELDEMERVHQMFGSIGAWKTYPGWSPNNTEQSAPNGYFYDDPVLGIPMIEKGLSLGVKTFCIHKGLPIPGFSTNFNFPDDIGRIAGDYPEASFVVYHSGYGNNNSYVEGPYQDGNKNGVNSLVTALAAAGVGPGQNVYAELGTTWQIASTHPIVGGPQAMAHVLGKLLLAVGEDNVVWGTDSIWYGSPQSQIESFLQFQIPESMRSQYGYPELTLDIKRKILGLNAARVYGVDPVAMRCGIDASQIMAAKLELDHELGARRWAFHRPMLESRRRFMQLLRRDSRERPG
jgi:hypothetical protein